MQMFKKKTREEKMSKRAGNVLLQLFSDVDCQFTELETVQILNMVRRKAAEYLEAKKAEAMEQSVNFNQKAKEIGEAVKLIE